MQPDRDDHCVRTPPVQLAQDTETRHISQRENVVVGPLQSRPVIKHQEDAGYCFHQKQEKSHASHTPSVTESDSLLFDRDRMEMQKEVREHHDDSIPPIHRCGMPEDTFPDL